MMKEVSKDTGSILEIVRKCSEVLDSADLNDHAASLAMLQVLGQRRVEAFKGEQERLKQSAQSKLSI